MKPGLGRGLAWSMPPALLGWALIIAAITGSLGVVIAASIKVALWVVPVIIFAALVGREDA